MHAQRKLFLVLLTLCGYWLAAAPVKALPLEGVAQGFFGCGNSAAPAKAKRSRHRAGRTAGKNAPAKKPTETAAPDAPPPPTARPGPPPPPPPPPNVTLKAALASGTPPLTEGVGWRVLAEKPIAGQAEKLVWSGGGAEPSFHLDPGHYYVEATFGLARNGQDIQIPADNPLESTVVLNAGVIRAEGIAVAGGPALDDMFYILRQNGQPGAPPIEIGRSSLPEATFYVLAGAYRLAMEHGLASTEVPVVVAAGQEVRAQGVLNSGHLKLAAKASAGGQFLDDAVFFVYAEIPNAPPREIARSKLSRAEFDLPAGRYRIAAQWGLARVERQVTIKAGVVDDETLVLDAGVVKMTSVLAGSDKPLDRSIVYKIYALSGDQGASTQSIATLAKAQPTLYLKSGKYRIESQYGWHNAKQSREVDVAAGQVTELVFEQRASEVQFKLVLAPGKPAPGRVKWTVKYASGGTVLISQDDAPSLILQAGSYQVVAQYNNKTYSRAFEANPNEVNVIELVAE